MHYFHEFFREQAQREIIICHVPPGAVLPKGHYAFIESYCSNPGCDCKEVLIEIIAAPDNQRARLDFALSAVPLAVLKYAWKEPFSEQNPALESAAAEPRWPEAALKLFQDAVQTHPDYVMRFDEHYSLMKKRGETTWRLSKAIEHAFFSWAQSEPKIGRNALCPCGSGKKFKKCCLNISDCLKLPNKESEALL